MNRVFLLLLGIALLVACSDKSTSATDDSETSSSGTRSSSEDLLSFDPASSSEILNSSLHANSSGIITSSGTYSSSTHMTSSSSFSPSGSIHYLTNENFKLPRVYNEPGATYIIQGRVEVKAATTFGPNVLVKVEDNLSLEGVNFTVLEGTTFLFAEGIYFSSNTGTAQFKGTAESPIHLANLTGGKLWGVISLNGRSSIEYATIDSSESGVSSAHNTLVAHCVFTNNKVQALSILDTINPLSVKNTFSNNGASIRVDAEFLSQLPADQYFLTPDPIILYQWQVTYIKANTVWPKLPVPFLLKDSLVFTSDGSGDGTLLIPAGTHFLIPPGGYISAGVQVGLKLTIAGTATEPVTMSPAVAGTYWGSEQSIYNTPYGGLILGYAVHNIQYLIVDSATTGIFDKSSSHSVIENTEIRNSKHIGMRLPAYDGYPFKGLKFVNNGEGSITTNFNGMTRFDNTSTFEGVNEKIIISATNVDTIITIRNFSVPYIVNDVFKVESKSAASNPIIATVEPGTHFLMATEAYFQAIDYGTLIMKGTAAAPIVIENLELNTTWGRGTKLMGTAFGIVADYPSKSEFEYITFRGVIDGVFPIALYPPQNATEPNTVVVNTATIQNLGPR